MVTRRTKYGWMMLGGLLCMFALVFACKVRDGNRAYGQSPPVPEAKGEAGVPVPANLQPPPPPTAVEPPAPSAGSEAKPILIPAGAAAAPPTSSAPPPGAPLPPLKQDADITPPAETKPVIPAKLDVPGEPPLAPADGPVIPYKVRGANETFKSLARTALNNAERWSDIHKLNPTFKADATLPAGTVVRLPGDACVDDGGEAVRPLPNMRTRTPAKAKTMLPLTGSYHVTLDDKRGMTLPKAVRDQLGNCDTVMVSPGSDKCLWLTNQAHLDRMAAKLDKSTARESDVRTFKRLYYAQTVKVPMKDGHLSVTDKLAQFAGLGQELVLVGIDDHFEVWDAARWRRYTQAKKATGDD